MSELVPLPSLNRRGLSAHLLFRPRQAVPERRPGKQQIGVFGDGLRLRRQIDFPIQQPPQNRRDGRVHQREFVRQEIRFGFEHVRARQDAVTKNLARENGVALEDGPEFLSMSVMKDWLNDMTLTISFKVLGRLEMYRLVEHSSPSALRRELKDSYQTSI